MNTLDLESNLHLEDLSIRLVSKKDLPALEWNGEFIKYRRMYTDLYRESLAGRTLLWVIEIPGREIIGQAFVMLTSSENDAADGLERAYIFAFRVKENYRNHGVGTHLMNFIENDLCKRGFKFATLNVAKENIKAQRLYQRLGYKIIGARPGNWSFKDHLGNIQHVNEPAWRMMKRISTA